MTTEIITQDKDEVLIETDIIHRTKKAICIENMDGENCYIPISQIEIIDMDAQATVVEMVIPRWLAESKELI